METVLSPPGYGERYAPKRIMNLTDFRNMQRRVERAMNAVSKNESAEGFSQALNSHSDEKLVVKGMRSPEELEDDILNLCIWIWSMKDYLRTLASTAGIPPQKIEDIANDNDSLAIVADLANRAKHGKLTKSRTKNKDFAILAGVGFKVNQTALNSIAFGESEVTLDVGKPNDATLNARIEFESGNRDAIEDAFGVIGDAITIWETEAYPLIGA